MSRIGKKPITIPQGVQVAIAKDNTVAVTGPKGTLQQAVHPDIKVEVQADVLLVQRPTEQKRHKALHGLYRSLVHNMVVGVHQGYKKSLELIGVGYKVALQEGVLELDLGHSHKIYFALPPEVSATVEGSKQQVPTIHLASSDKQLLGQVAAKLYDLRRPNPYTGKGVRFIGQEVRRKVAKTTK